MVMMARLDKFHLPVEDTELAAKIGDHVIQATYAEQEDFDDIIYGPTELQIQHNGIKRLIDKEGTKVIVWNYTATPPEWRAVEPSADFSFTHLAGLL